ncbi:MAG: alginate lyase family protein [Candidatus Pedobacter colombiensis]|uniref:Alginate lyase family protein n=1 Tax=Candidatus Pedobacter colombiensis TaxID=3121371 RepID=A0AAJ5WAH1_9SPHI|nr:alginate lyase family protein [Pedobacter sp.]WEK20338.1 MAG: alginate lyase family protein [Pedobacter sp.]
MRKIFFFAIVLSFTVSVKAQYVSLNDNEVQKLKALIGADTHAKQMYANYQAIANAAINETPQPIDTIQSEGLLKGNPKKTATANALRDVGKMYALAICYRVEHKKSYLESLASYLTAWATNNTSRGNPINDTNLEDAIVAYDLVKTYLQPKDNALTVKWLDQIANAAITMHSKSLKKETSYNNWRSHQLKIVGLIAYAIDHAGYKKYVAEHLKEQLEKNLYANGSGVDFKLRDALHYHVYDLEPLLRLAIVLKRATGVNVYSAVSASGSSIQKSVEWLLPYVTGEKTHAEYVNSTVKFDQARAQNGESAYKAGNLWNPKSGLKVMALAAYFDPQYNSTIKAVTGTTNEYSSWQLVLNKVMM